MVIIDMMMMMIIIIILHSLRLCKCGRRGRTNMSTGSTRARHAGALGTQAGAEHDIRDLESRSRTCDIAS